MGWGLAGVGEALMEDVAGEGDAATEEEATAATEDEEAATLEEEAGAITELTTVGTTTEEVAEAAVTEAGVEPGAYLRSSRR